ncbi:hypothetical protein [Streptomyces sp. NBC_00212]|uniref:LppU/SCO3897 family protein n=1 Tax=Streptomyces sp. NBC_00212 TaxID=2975684 RepID=UPI003245F94D
MTTPPQGQNPYAQNPNAPYGQPQGGVPQQPSPYFNQGAPIPNAPVGTPTRKTSKAVLRIVAVIVIAILVAVGKWWFSQTDAETTAVGSCMHNSGTTLKPDLSTVDCSAGNAQYKVVGKFDNTSDDSKCAAISEAQVSYIQSGSSDHNVVLCLAPVKK